MHIELLNWLTRHCQIQSPVPCSSNPLPSSYNENSYINYSWAKLRISDVTPACYFPASVFSILLLLTAFPLALRQAWWHNRPLPRMPASLINVWGWIPPVLLPSCVYHVGDPDEILDSGLFVGTFGSEAVDWRSLPPPHFISLSLSPLSVSIFVTCFSSK